MATVFFVRNGTGDPRTNTSTEAPEVSIDSVISKLGQYEFEALKDDPLPFGFTEPASEYVFFKYVVIKIHSNETCSKFPKSGLYLVKGMSPGEFNKQFNMNVPTV
jgi:hypothetical protein